MGIIGAGRTSAAHARALHQIPDLQIAGILDIDAEAAQRLASQFGVTHHFSDTDQFYAVAKPQIVHVLTPPHSHEDVAMDALDRGAHVLVEKPAALTVAGCDALQKKADLKQLTVGLNENFTLDPRVQAAGDAIARGEIGRPVHIEGFFGFDTSILGPNLENCPWARLLPGGMLEDLLPHLLTVARALAGKEEKLVYWQVISAGRLPFGIADELRLFLFAEDCPSVNLCLSLSAKPADFVFTIYGTRATIRVDLRNLLCVMSRPASRSGAVGKALRIGASVMDQFAQTARNAIGISLFRGPKPSSPIHLIRAHYAALRAGDEVPAPISRAKWIVQTTRQIWPHPTTTH